MPTLLGNAVDINTPTKPLSGVTVVVGNQRTTTSANGLYQTRQINAGTYTVKMSKTGYAEVNTTMKINAGANILNAQMTPTQQFGSLIGNVIDTANNSQPLAGVLVTVGSSYTGTTNSLGNFSINNIPVGTYPVVFSKADYGPIQG